MVKIPILFATVGLPASGKSTLARLILKYYDKIVKELNREIHDKLYGKKDSERGGKSAGGRKDIITSEHEEDRRGSPDSLDPNDSLPRISDKIKHIDIDLLRDNGSCNIFHPNMERKARRRFLDLCNTELSRGYSVVADDMNYLTSMRHDLYMAAQENRALFVPIYFSPDRELSLMLNKHRKERVLDDIIENVYVKLDRPGKRYGWDRPVLTILPKLRKVPEEWDAIIDELITALKRTIPAKIERILRERIAFFAEKGVLQGSSENDRDLAREIEIISRKIIGYLIRLHNNGLYSVLKEAGIEYDSVSEWLSEGDSQRAEGIIAKIGLNGTDEEEADILKGHFKLFIALYLNIFGTDSRDPSKRSIKNAITFRKKFLEYIRDKMENEPDRIDPDILTILREMVRFSTNIREWQGQ